MKVLYIGQCEEGSTSKMRFDVMSSYFNVKIDLINVSDLIFSTNKIFRTLGWRLKIGPLIWRVNQLINYTISQNDMYDLIWIDKGVFISFDTMMSIRSKCIKLVHFTPDPAFFYHNSRFFKKSLTLYDYCITTKSFELSEYKRYGCQNLIYSPQCYDELIHKPLYSFEEKVYDVCFIGHYEKERALILQNLIDNNIRVVIGGIKWSAFAKKNKYKTNFTYVGSHLAGLDYSRVLSSSKIGLGLLSKWIPEKHTTRTFEIPACGTFLATEINDEIFSFFGNDVLYFSDSINLLSQVNDLLKNPFLLKSKIIQQSIRLEKIQRSYRVSVYNNLKVIGL
jgi:spore maturation protein CgeB